MTDSSTVKSGEILSWLEHLYTLSPASATLLIGAGTSQSIWIKLLQKLSAQNVTLVEANSKRLQKLKDSLIKQTDWNFVHSLIAQNEESTLFYQTSYEAENGLTKPEELEKIWPNITLLKPEEKDTVTLNALQKTLETPTASWLIIDCLSAHNILEDGEQLLESIDVIVVRELLSEVTPELDKHSNKHVIYEYLSQHNYRLLAEEPESNPVIGHALYIKNKDKNIEKEESDVNTDSNLTKKNNELHKQLENTTQQLNEAEYKQLLLNNELVKAKAQIELIKDMLLHEEI